MPAVAHRSPIPTSTSTAARLADANWNENLRALRITRSPLAELLLDIETDLEWVFARDGTLTGRTTDERWWAGCSVPLLAGRALLATLEADPLASCLLAPAHAGLVLASRERMGAGPALLVIQPDALTLRIILSCHDFSADIQNHRLWFVGGSEWAGQLRQLFDDYSGLATPARFIKSKLLLPEIEASLIADAQAVFSAVLEDRLKVIDRLRTSDVAVTNPSRLLLIGGSRFRLWDDGAAVLREQLTGFDAIDFDTDHPLSTSPIALMEAARQCGGIISVDLCRADSTSRVSTALPWITWMTRPAAPPFMTAGPKDYLILADANWREIARAAGWSDDRVRVCGWSSTRGSNTFSAAPVLGMLCDTEPVQIPKSIDEFSSHRVLWEMIEAELHDTPLIVGDPDEYLCDRARQLTIDIETLDRPRFIRGLIVPKFQQGLARLLLNAGLPLRIWGRGWDQHSEFSGCIGGSLNDRPSFEAAIAACSVLLYCWPIRNAHPIDATGKPVLFRSGREIALLVRNARQMLAKPIVASTAGDVCLKKVISGLIL